MSYYILLVFEPSAILINCLEILLNFIFNTFDYSIGYKISFHTIKNHPSKHILNQNCRYVVNVTHITNGAPSKVKSTRV